MKKAIAITTMALTVGVSSIAGASPLSGRYHTWAGKVRPIIGAVQRHYQYMVADLNMNNEAAVRNDLTLLGGDAQSLYNNAYSPDAQTNKDTKLLAAAIAYFVVTGRGVLNGTSSGSEFSNAISIVTKYERVLTADITRDNRLYN